MEEEVIDNDIFEKQAIEAGLEDYLNPTDVDIQEEEEIDSNNTDDSYDFDEDPLDLFQDVEDLTDDDIDEINMFSPRDAERLNSLKIGNELIGTYLKHQQGISGYTQIVSGNLSEKVKRNMRNNLPSSLSNVSDSTLRDTFLGYWRNKLGNTKITATSEQIKAISSAATEMGESPDTWLRIAQIESAFNPQAISPSGNHKGLFQVKDTYVNNSSLLQDPYYSTKIAIRHNKNQFKDGKLDYQLGGGIQYSNYGGLSASGYTPSNNIQYSSKNPYFSNNVTEEFDPTGITKLISKADRIGGAGINAISSGLNGYKEIKDIIGKSTDIAVTSISSILEEKQAQRDYINTLKKLYGENTYSGSPLTDLIKPSESYT